MSKGTQTDSLNSLIADYAREALARRQALIIAGLGKTEIRRLQKAVIKSHAPLYCVSSEIGLWLVPAGKETTRLKIRGQAEERDLTIAECMTQDNVYRRPIRPLREVGSKSQSGVCYTTKWQYAPRRLSLDSGLL